MRFVLPPNLPNRSAQPKRALRSFLVMVLRGLLSLGLTGLNLRQCLCELVLDLSPSPEATPLAMDIVRLVTKGRSQSAKAAPPRGARPAHLHAQGRGARGHALDKAKQIGRNTIKEPISFLPELTRLAIRPLLLPIANIGQVFLLLVWGAAFKAT